MKSKLMLAMAVIVAFGSVKAMAAQSDSSIDPIEMENINGKWDASELNVNLDKIQSQIDEMKRMQDSLEDMDDSHGLMSALGQSIDTAEALQKQVQQSSNVDQSRQLVKTIENTLVTLRAQRQKL